MPGTDVVIIGGGIVGTSTAWNLARAGASVILCEQSVVGAGASGRTGALLRQHYSNEPESHLARASLDIFRKWPEVIGGPPVHHQMPLVVTVPSTGPFQINIGRMRRNVARLATAGVDTRVIGLEELQELQPGVICDDLEIAALEGISGYADAPLATRSMAQAAIRAGATIVEDTQVSKIAMTGSRVTGVECSRGSIEARHVVVASGPWAPRLLQSISIDVPIQTQRVQVGILSHPVSFTTQHYVYLDGSAGNFFRPFGEGRTLIGIGGGEYHDRVDPDTFEEGVDPGFAAAIKTAIARRFPALAASTMVYGWSGLYDMTPDTHALIGPIGPDGLVLAAGFSGAGFKKGPAVGQALSELVLTGKSTTFDLSWFDPNRFASPGWRLPWGPYEYDFGVDFGHRL